MRVLKIFSFIILFLGILVSFFFTNMYAELSGDAFGGGYGLILFGIPLICLGIILFGLSLNGLARWLFFLLAICLVFASFASMFIKI